MVTQITGLSGDVAGFRATGTVTKEDYDTIIYPAVKKICDHNPELNFLMVLDNHLKNFTPGAWMKDAAMGLKHLTRWKKIAIVSDEAMVKTAMPIMDTIAPGQYKAFAHKDVQLAFNWVSEKTKGG